MNENQTSLSSEYSVVEWLGYVLQILCLGIGSQSLNFHESISVYSTTVQFLRKKKVQWQILKRKKNRCGMIENRSQGVESNPKQKDLLS